jgi:Zn-finger nucleic acid-binding protein
VRCAECQSLLREFAGRLICDACGALLVPHGDLVDVLGGDVRVIDDTPTQRVCPRCDGRLRACRISVDGSELDHDTLHCKRDGVWLAGGMLEDILEGLGRESHVGSPGAGGGGGVQRGPGMPFGTSFSADGASGRDPLWFRARKARPMKGTPFQSAFAGQSLTCPACAVELSALTDRYTCSRCKGVFVETAALEEMMAGMRGEPWQLPLPSGGPSRRGCPVCGRPMTLEHVEAIELDRCRTHGVWFDDEELADTLLASV